jgi:photosystem II stability/assembly factor-like uncharacterized protein
MIARLRPFAPLSVAALTALLTTHSLAAQSAMPVAQQFDKLHFRSIGPAIMSGRIADFAVYEKNTAIWYVGTAHGGVWKTTSNGALLTPIFEDKGLMSIGDVTVSQNNPDLVWVGTGESNNRQSTSWGDGVFKSADGGKTFQNMGLKDSKHINRILIDPANDNVVLVAATGSLFGPGGDRGVYKTTDGGASWKRVLYVDEETGANDLAMSATDPKTIYASTYQRRRSECCMNGGGPGSGVWKSTDGGDTWTRLAGGLPSGPLGRIGIDTYRRNGNIVYASIEGPTAGRGGAAAEGVDSSAAPAAAAPAGGAGAAAADTGANGLYRSDDGGATWRKVSSNNPRPMYFSQVRVDPNNADKVYQGGVKMSVTADAGKTMEMSANTVAHDDTHAIWIDPSNSDHLLIGGDGGVYQSYDGSKTWIFQQNLPVGLFYHVNYDMSTPYGLCGGMQDNYDWCGPSQSRQQQGIFNHEWIQVEGGDGFEAIPDRRDARFVYSESQDGNLIRRNKVTGESKSIRPTPQNTTPVAKGETFRFHWDTPVMLSPNDPGTLVVGGNRVFVSHDRGDSWTAISPDLTKQGNRDTIVTMGLKGSDIHISRDDGMSQWPAIVAIAESPKQRNLMYAGTEDGNVWVARDGKTWTNITRNIPDFPQGDAFVSRVVPSAFDAGTVYLTVDNHRQNDYGPHMWMSTDFGQSFHSIVNNLVGENVRTLTEDQRNRDVLYIGTETGIFLSLDRGASWQRLKANFPNVRVDEITLHPRDNAMLVATHGRAIWILDHLEPIQEYTAAQNANADVKLFTPGAALQWKLKDERNDEFWGHSYFIGENPPNDAVIEYFVKKPATNLELRVSDASGKVVRELKVPDTRNQPGIQTICWDMRAEGIAAADSAAAAAGGRGGRGGGAGGRGAGAGGQAVPGVSQPVPTPINGQNPCIDGAAPAGRGGGGGGGGGGLGGPGPYVMPGAYTVALTSNGKVLDSKPLKLLFDPDVKFAAGEQEKYNAMVTDLQSLQAHGVKVANALNALHPQMADVGQKVTASSTVPATVKAQFESFNKQYEAVRKKFGVPLPVAAAGGRGAGGGRGGPPIDPENVLGKTAALRTAVVGIWETPSASLTRQYSVSKVELPKAIAQANAVLARAIAMSATLKKYDITLNAPAAGK